MISLTNILLAVFVAIWFVRKARAAGKQPGRWAWVGAASYFLPALALASVLLGFWLRSFPKMLIPLEVHFFITALLYPLLAILVPSVAVGLIASMHVYCTYLSNPTARQMNPRTYLFEAVAVLVAFAGWLGRPAVPGTQAGREFVGRVLFPEFTDRRSAIALEVVSPNLETFRVAQDASGRWTIPSHDNYPADYGTHLGQAASAFINLKIGALASEDPETHAQYGVLEPTQENRGASGVGTKVSITDSDQKVYSLIIGNEVPERFGQRYVRVPDQNAVLVVELQADQFSTKFEDWIEKNLLSIKDSSNIKSIWLADYSIDVIPQQIRRGNLIFTVDRPVPKPRGRVIVEYRSDSKPDEPRWKLVEDKVLREDKQKKEFQWVDASLAPDEELDLNKLDDLRYALTDLKIVNVRRKHPELARYLREKAKFPEDFEAEELVEPYGFHMVPVAQNEKLLSWLVPLKDKEKAIELLSAEGDVRVAMNTGVVYVLRFGSMASGTEAPGKKPEAKQPEKQPAKKPAEPEKPQQTPAEKEKPAGPGVNRYLFIMAEFDPDLIPKPKLQPLPELPKPGESPKTESPKSEASKPEPPEKSGPAKTPDTAKTPETAKQEPDKKTEAAKPDPEEERKRIEAERKRIEKENQEEQKKYDKKIEDGKKEVQELNARFADWFYVIAESEYQKVHLSRKDILKKKEKKEEEKKEEKKEIGKEEQKKEPPEKQPETKQEAAKPAATPPPQTKTQEPPAAKPQQPAAPQAPEPAPPPKQEPATPEPQPATPPKPESPPGSKDQPASARPGPAPPAGS
ncbi:MAG: DUF4340 domain-containing protein [Thermoguttaceae bacterium]